MEKSIPAANAVSTNTTKSGREVLLDIQDLRVWYKTYLGDAQVVDGINITVHVGEKIGIVGESGCGKTTTMKTVLRLLDPRQIKIPSGRILFRGEDILQMKDDGLMDIRRKRISMISQEPMAALNPVFTIGEQLADIIKYSGQYPGAKKKEIDELVKKAISDVMISDPERIMNSYPHQLSGGMRQRICIAMSLVTPRDLLIADEPGTALDVTIQDQIHRLLRTLVEEKGRSLIMITHSLGVARELVDQIYIMYAGNIVEKAPTKMLFGNPSHPYTQGLLECVPRLFGGGINSGIYGYVPNYNNPGSGCRFAPRCKNCENRCWEKKPPMTEIEPGHFVACWQYSAREEGEDNG